MSEAYELTVMRHIDAPRDVVWTAFTERMAAWWAPKPWTTEIVERDLRPGGRSAMVMRGPEGEEALMEGVYLEVRPAELVVFTDAFAAGWVPQGPSFVGLMAFEDAVGNRGDGTRYTARARHWTEESYQGHKAMGFEQGWATVADQLAAIAEAMAKA